MGGGEAPRLLQRYPAVQLPAGVGQTQSYWPMRPSLPCDVQDSRSVLTRANDTAMGCDSGQNQGGDIRGG